MLVQIQGEKAVSNKILQAASKLFAQKGYSNVSIRHVCREAETTAPVIYYYFGSKKGLFDAAVRKSISMGDFVGKLEQASLIKDTSEAVDEFVSVYLSSFPEHAFDTGFYLRDSASLDRESARMISVDLDRIRKVASKMVSTGVKRGSFRKTDPYLAADCLLGMLNRVIFQRIHFSKASDREAYGAFVADFFKRALG